MDLSRDPLYQQVAGHIRTEIIAGRYAGAPYHDKLPSEADLMAEYDVARDTVRRALARLQAEGLISSERGRGTFVRTPALRLRSSRFGRQARRPGLGPFEATCEAAGVPGRTNMVTVEHVPASDEVALGLDVEPGTTVVHRCRHMRAGDPERVIQIQDGYLLADMVAGTPLAEHAKVADGIYAALEAIGHAPDTSTEVVAARMATPEEAHNLGIRNGIPVIVIQRRTYDEDDRIIEWLRVVATADANEFEYERLPLR